MPWRRPSIASRLSGAIGADDHIQVVERNGCGGFAEAQEVVEPEAFYQQHEGSLEIVSEQTPARRLLAVAGLSPWLRSVRSR